MKEHALFFEVYLSDNLFQIVFELECNFQSFFQDQKQLPVINWGDVHLFGDALQLVVLISLE